MSLQSDLRNPELGYFDEGMNLADASLYERACRPFGEATMLPPVAYRSKAFLELENEKVWTRSWVAIGLQQQIPRPGDLLPFTLGFHGVHVQRNPDGTIAARMNRHQHGGCRFVPEQCRTGRQTKCSITSCNYTRDADVMQGGENGENTDVMYKFVGLVPERLAPVKCETWGPFIFINLDPECGPLADCLGDFPDMLGPQLSGPLALGAKQWLDFECNWKMAGAAFTGMGRVPAGVVDEPARTYARAEIDQGAELYWLFPNVLMAVCPDHVAIVLLQATGMGKCLYRFFLLTAAGAAADPSVDASADERVGQWLSFLTANGAGAEIMHRDIILRGTSYRPGTGIDDLPLETNRCSHALNRFLASRIEVEHHYYWNAPIMDGAMMMRGTR